MSICNSLLPSHLYQSLLTADKMQHSQQQLMGYLHPYNVVLWSHHSVWGYTSWALAIYQRLFTRYTACPALLGVNNWARLYRSSAKQRCQNVMLNPWAKAEANGLDPGKWCRHHCRTKVLAGCIPPPRHPIIGCKPQPQHYSLPPYLSNVPQW